MPISTIAATCRPCCTGASPVDAFSAHADAGDVLAWLKGAPEPATTYVVHGEAAAAAVLRERIDHELGWTDVVPALGERVVVRARTPAAHRQRESAGRLARNAIGGYRAREQVQARVRASRQDLGPWLRAERCTAISS